MTCWPPRAQRSAFEVALLVVGRSLDDEQRHEEHDDRGGRRAVDVDDGWWQPIFHLGGLGSTR